MNFSLILLCGIPASGKTYLMEALVSLWKKTIAPLGIQSKLHPISFDQFVPLCLQKDLIQVEGQWKECRKDLRAAVDAYVHWLTDGTSPTTLTPRQVHFFKMLHNDVSKDPGELPEAHILVVEDNFYYPSMRQEWQQLALKYEMGYCQVYIDCPTIDAQTRNATRTEQVPPDVISRIAERTQAPSKDDPHAMILSATESLESKLEKVLKAIATSLQNPLKRIQDNSAEKEASKVICSQNIIHQADIILRKLTGKKIKNLEAKSQEKVAQINSIRHTILENLRSGLLLLPTELCSSIEQGSPDLDWLEKEMILAFEHYMPVAP